MSKRWSLKWEVWAYLNGHELVLMGAYSQRNLAILVTRRLNQATSRNDSPFTYVLKDSRARNERKNTLDTSPKRVTEGSKGVPHSP